jgi:hypothetical protein
MCFVTFRCSAQSLFSDAMTGFYVGAFRNNYTVESPMSGLVGMQPGIQINVWKRKIGLLTTAAIEYAFQANKNSSTLQLDRALYLTPGMRVNITGNPLGKNLFIEYGFGLERRLKLNESNYWNISQGGGPVPKYRNSYNIMPVHFSLMKPGKKVNLRYRLNLSLQTPSPGDERWSFSTISFGVDLLKPLFKVKKYYNGTHRTLQVDDVWHPEK